VVDEMDIRDGRILSTHERGRSMFDAVIISDLHLGSDNCQARHLVEFLERIVENQLQTQRLILNGDVFDSIDFRRLKKTHWKVLSLLRKLSDHLEIIWLCGNHDGSAEIVSHLLGVTVAEEYALTSGQEKILVLHGHRFDEFIDNHPFITWLADCIYCFLQKLDRDHYWAKLAKKSSKTFLRCTKLIEDRSKEYAQRHGYTAVCCGHTHVATTNRNGPVAYYNSGCWTELPCTYLAVQDGRVEVLTFVPETTVVKSERDVETIPA
jgi:UDP-2,3-diacylglucosamine pyrophosphatase LpxH